MSRAAAAAWAAVPLLAGGIAVEGCGGGASPVSGDAALHLDPRLADGRASALVLAERREIVRAFEGAGGLSVWRPDGLDAVPTAGGEGLVLEQRRGAVSCGLVLDEPVDAADVDVLELEARMPDAGSAWLRWLGADDPPGVHSLARALRVSAPGGPEARALRFPLRGHPEWRGEVRSLRVELPAARLGAAPVLLAARLVRLGHLADADAPDDRDAARGDGGFVSLQGVSVRAWPTDFDVPLSARLHLPAGARLDVATAVSLAARGLEAGAVGFAVDVRPAGGAWTLAGGHALPVAQHGTWRPLAVDLAAFAGEDVELRLRAFRAPRADLSLGPGEGGSLEHGDVLWGAPVVVGERPAERRPSVLLVTLDTTRADAIGAYGGTARTPRIDELAAESVTFTDAWSTSNSTQPSHATILSGTFVKDHGVVNNFALFSGAATTVAERLRAAGWATAAAVSQQHLGTKAGFGQGFDVFLEAHPEGHADGAHAVEAARAWLDSLGAGADRPVFLWVHLFDPHTPYAPPEQWVERYSVTSPPPPRRVEPPTLPALPPGVPADLAFLSGATSLEWARWAYASGVSYADFLVGRLLDELAQRGHLDGAVVALVADHGEGLGEHDAWFAHTGLFEETVRVPLILRAPGLPAGTTCAAPVSTVDLAPTIFAACGLEPERGMRGVDLARVARSKGGLLRAVWFEHSDRLQVGLRDERYHAILSLAPRMRTLVRVTDPAGGARLESAVRELGEVALFEHASDPELARDLSAERPEVAEAYAARIRAWLADAQALEGAGRAMSGDEVQQLEHAGYVGAGEH